MRIRLPLHEIRSVYKIGTGKSRQICSRSVSCPVPNEFTCESDPVWNCTIARWYNASVNQGDEVGGSNNVN